MYQYAFKLTHCLAIIENTLIKKGVLCLQINGHYVTKFINPHKHTHGRKGNFLILFFTISINSLLHWIS